MLSYGENWELLSIHRTGAVKIEEQWIGSLSCGFIPHSSHLIPLNYTDTLSFLVASDFVGVVVVAGHVGLVLLFIVCHSLHENSLETIRSSTRATCSKVNI